MTMGWCHLFGSNAGRTTPREGTQVVPTDDTQAPDSPPVEIGGRKGPDPVRYGDWEKNGRCIDF